MQIISKISHVYYYHPISHGSQRCASVTTVTLNHQLNQDQYQPNYLPIMHQPIYQPPVYQTPVYQPHNISTAATSNLSNTHHSNTTSKPSSNDIREPKIEDHPKLEISNGCTSTNPQLFPPTVKIFPTQNPNSQYYLSLLITPEDAASSNQGIEQQQLPTNNIPSAIITKNKSLDAIFPFELKEPLDMSLFKTNHCHISDAKIDDHSIKLILNSGCQVDCTVSTRIITTDGATKIPIGEIDNFSIEVNGIIVSIKVLNGQHTQVPAMCGYFKATNTTAPLIDFEEEKPKPTWEREKGKRKAKEEEPLPTVSYTSYTDIPPQLLSYCKPKLICIDCDKKLLSIGACCSNDKEYQMATKFYCHACLVECFQRPKRVRKWCYS
ncbi:hypothetical protein G9A89_018388 [Geosiphon pyriformis]|nr:hypothetical protein G9A89_018388 [Geosiphon pyriformis]